MDFGGMGYLKLASKLSEKATVEWVFSARSGSCITGLKKVLNQYNIKVHHQLSSDLSSKALLSKEAICFKELENLLVSNKYQLIIIDRLMAPIETILNKLKLPYITIGSDGMDWYNNYDRIRKKFYVTKKQKGTKIWAVSPMSNINFLPSWFYNSNNDLSVKIYDEVKSSTAEYILVTFGNSMPESVQVKLFELILKYSVNTDEKIALCYGNSLLGPKIEETCKFHSNITPYKWVNYDDVFQKASIAIGHGGTAFVWYALKYKVPTICIPVMADQLYNSITLKNKGLSDILIEGELGLVRQSLTFLGRQKLLKEKHFYKALAALKNKPIDFPKEEYDLSSINDLAEFVIEEIR
jgi:spore coat polysaccharide biosynthesis predicted glycosyltransferase SpsG